MCLSSLSMIGVNVAYSGGAWAHFVPPIRIYATFFASLAKIQSGEISRDIKIMAVNYISSF